MRTTEILYVLYKWGLKMKSRPWETAPPAVVKNKMKWLLNAWKQLLNSHHNLETRSKVYIFLPFSCNVIKSTSRPDMFLHQTKLKGIDSSNVYQVIFIWRYFVCQTKTCDSSLVNKSISCNIFWITCFRVYLPFICLLMPSSGELEEQTVGD